MMLEREKWETNSVHDLAFIPLGRFNDGIYDNVLSHSNAYRGANQALDFLTTLSCRTCCDYYNRRYAWVTRWTEEGQFPSLCTDNNFHDTHIPWTLGRSGWYHNQAAMASCSPSYDDHLNSMICQAHPE